VARNTRSAKRWIRTAADERAVAEGCWFDPDAADHACDFIETFVRYSTGDPALIGQPVTLLDWQRDLLSRLFGWRRDGTRRHRAASVWVAKKNGKTTLAAWVLLYLLVADGEAAAEVYSVANSTEQASQIFREARAVVEASPELRRHLEIVPSTGRIVFPATRSFYRVLSSKAATAEGLNASGIVFDELHRQRDDDLFNALRWAGAARRQPLFVTISTAGVFDPTSISYRQYKVAKDIVTGIDDRTTDLLPAIYEIEAEDDWTTKNPNAETVWRKANPSLGVTINTEDFRRDVENIEQNPSQLSAFLRYRLNVWSSASTTWIPDDKWQACKGSVELTPEEISALTWTAGLDASTTIDVTSLVLFGRGEGKSYVLPYFWINEEQASLRQKRDQVNYEVWARAGHMRVTEGNVIDFDVIRRDIGAIFQKYPVEKLAIDRWATPQLAQQLQGDGWHVCYYGQGYKDMTPAVREVERLVYSGEITHDCPVLRWMMSNVEIETDAAGNVKASKKRSREKIDGVVALLMAVGVGLNSEPESVYEQRAKKKSVA
jgi:phage terminase large subunit-like protein